MEIALFVEMFVCGIIKKVGGKNTVHRSPATNDSHSFDEDRNFVIVRCHTTQPHAGRFAHTMIVGDPVTARIGIEVTSWRLVSCDGHKKSNPVFELQCRAAVAAAVFHVHAWEM